MNIERLISNNAILRAVTSLSRVAFLSQTVVGSMEDLRAAESISNRRQLYEGSAKIETVISICRKNGFVLKGISEAFRGSNGELFEADALFVKA